MSEKRWSREEFLDAIREKRRVEWVHGKVKGNGAPGAGDAIILFYAPTDAKAPGICGRGFIERFDPRRETITFRVLPPTNRLQRDPWWDRKMKKLADDIRGVPRATMFSVDRKQAKALRLGIEHWLRKQ